MRSTVQWMLMSLLAFSPAALAATPEPAKDYVEEVKGTVVKIDMVRIPGGKVKISPDGKAPPVEVEVKPFWIAKTETTWEQYDTFALQLDLPQAERKMVKWPDAKERPSPPYDAPDHGWGHNGWPAIHISHYASKMYCVWLSKKTGKKYRLPSEAEWVYACRAGNANGVKGSEDIAWAQENSEDEQTHPVAKKKANAWGLYDMLGNVAEWCNVTPDGKTGVVRGGHYLAPAGEISCDKREPYTPAWQLKDPNEPKGMWWFSDGSMLGFRVVCEE